MKKIIFSVITFWLTVVNGIAQIDDRVYVSDFNITPIGSQDIAIQLENPENDFCAFQFDLSLPQGIAIALDEDGMLDVNLNENRKNNHILSAKRINEECYRFVCYSMTNAVFNGNIGAIIDVKIEAVAAVTDVTTMMGSVRNIVLTKVDGSDLRLDNTSFNIFVSEPKYVLTYVIDGVVYKTIEKTIGETIATESVPVKEGYTFSGWSKAPDVMPAEDVTIYGSFAVNKYLVTFKIGDEVIASDSLEYGVTIVAPEAPEKEGYTFNAWENMPQTVPANDVVIKGLYTANEYLLAFVIDGALYEMHKVKCDEKIEAFETEEREGYTFIWENWIDKMPAKDYTIRGKYVPNKYGITYIVDGETIQNDSVEYGTVIVLPGEPIKEGYTFSGWSEAPETMPAEDVTISGFFTVNKYLVTFVIDDEVIASDSLEYGASIVAPIAPEKEGHTFNGWGEVAETVPAEDVTYYGSYSVNSYLLTYVVDGETVQSDSVAYGSTIVALEEPTKEGHTFSGWSEIPETMPAEDVTISGFFTVNKYLVTFVIDDEVIASDSLEYGASIVAPIAPEKEGHTFNGWGEVAETVPAEDITYYGSYSVNSYLLSYVVDGETVQSDSVAYGSTIVALEEPTKEGHTFSGWGEVPETMPAEDVVISGFFTVNTYKVYYYVGDELVHTAEVAYGEAIPEYAYEPTAEGDVFVGWVGETYETMPAHDVTYTANIESGIEEIENSKLGIESSVIYDLHGRKIQVDDLRELERGVYIIDNKKVVIK